ncbi:MAG: acylphosphatase [Desulfuromonadales bacterium]|jgi:acylphosphatase|nr:acylphosphatase [Desulfuromonadales bacterium]
MTCVRAELLIRGRVQGVFFRQSTRETANRLGLTGWVKNCPDGSVAAVFEGETTAIDAAIAWCRQGPPAAGVSEVEVDWQDFRGEFSGFDIRR